MSFFYRFSFLMVFIPIVIGINTTVSKTGSAANNSDNVTHNAPLPKVVNISATNSSFMTEGGAIGVQESISTVSKENITTLLIKAQSDPILDSSTKNKGTKSVVGRKGVDFNSLEDSAEAHKPENAPEVNITSTKAPSDAKSKTIPTNKVANNTVHLDPKKIEPTSPVPHKPLKLSSEALGADKTISLVEERIKHKQLTNPGSHPGMIMPIVITVLVVPMFAVLGYMALKRGQEAWKNRHYKRMDFLLDGMYND